MKRMLLTVLVLALAIPAAAQTDPPEGELGPIANGAHRLVVEFLELDEVQIEEWGVLWADHREAEAPIQQQIADIQQDIEEQFASGAPDPAELGLLMIERRALAEALKDVHAVYVEGFQLLLDDDQTRRLHEIRIADRIQGFIPAFKVFELVKR